MSTSSYGSHAYSGSIRHPVFDHHMGRPQALTLSQILHYNYYQHPKYPAIDHLDLQGNKLDSSKIEIMRRRWRRVSGVAIANDYVIIHMCVCTYNIYIYIHIYRCGYACMHVCMYACMYVCQYVCMYVRTYVCTYTYLFTCILKTD